MAQSLRVSGAMLARIARTTHPLTKRSFTASTAARMPDLIQDMYLKELRAYKVPEPKPGDADEYVQKFQAPAAPKSPEETNLASEVPEYQSAEVEVEGAAAAGESTEPEASYFEDLEDEPEEAHGGH